jgi:cholesterol transport system auxiliary component
LRNPVALLLCLSLPGCGIAFSAKYPDRTFHDIDVTRPGPRGGIVEGTALKVRRFRVSPRYEGVELVTRKSDLQYESDFYNAFFVPPASMLAEEVREWMERSGPFEHVLDFSSHVDATHVLEASVASLYADAVDPAAPKAVIEIQFFVIDDRQVPPAIAFRKDYRKEAALKEATADAVVRGWSAGLAQILAEFEGDLRELKLKP